MAKKILVVFTGGTIGSTLQDGWISSDNKTKHLLINNYLQKHGSNVEFQTLEPYTILSEDLSAEEINMLLSCVGDSLEESYDGIIVTHGTDTLQYSAAALSYAFEDAKIPLVMVSANYPLNDPRSNGGINFEAAVSFIESNPAGGVYVSYANSDDRVYIHKGNMLLSHGEADDKLFSLKDNVYASYKAGLIQPNHGYQDTEKRKSLGAFSLSPYSHILALCSYPGDSFQYSLEKCKAVVFRPYHSATINTKNPEARRFFLEAKKQGIPVFVVNVEGGYTYESVKEFDELGLIKLPFSSFVSAYMKAWIAVSVGAPLEEFMAHPIAGEFYVV